VALGKTNSNGEVCLLVSVMIDRLEGNGSAESIFLNGDENSGRYILCIVRGRQRLAGASMAMLGG